MASIDKINVKGEEYTINEGKWAKMARVVIFDNPSQPFKGEVTLSEPASDYDALLIECNTDDNEYFSTYVSDPEGKVIALSSAKVNPSAGSVFLKARAVKITGTTINTVLAGNASQYSVGQVQLPSGQISYNNYIRIIKVTGIHDFTGEEE